MRADLLLLERGLASSRSQAQRLIAAGVRWRQGEGAWRAVAKNGDELPDGAQIELMDRAEARYVSRGGLKLEGALRLTGLNPRQLRCLDVGQSTGGFTHCLLEHGAAQVVGLDVGHGQLHPWLRAHGQVLAIEGVNARALTPESFWTHHDRALADKPSAAEHFGGSALARDFDLLVADVSFISLTLVLPAVFQLLRVGGEALLLVKPQFELQPAQIGKSGLVRDPELFLQVRQRLQACLIELQFEVLAWLDSPIEGGDGNREFFLHARKLAADRPVILTAQPSAAAVRRPRRPSISRQLAEQADLSQHDGQPGPARRKRARPNPP